ncbi:hypothetical protein FQB35_14240 [Crassaminicella thermophila]|uniref:DUF2680 domain-containing protein n=1 Tax=Crassaminicella thermophila TaxID=2599308 RepID=A0A5C0SHX7_CRATE|nr:hypothetical protein [Crassaminicella thermophila]QEK13336.1 hypothetical protein FQB35_14240 [Crassaminicella thermophila]
MKKRILTLVLGGLLVVSSIGVAFASEVEKPATNTRGNGLGVYAQNLSVEELLKVKLERIDQLVKDEKITKEEGENYKKIITERMKDCTTVGENRENHERLGIGFGKGSGFGKGRGANNGLGRGMGLCRGTVNN